MIGGFYKKSDPKGFTLIELMVVVALIAIISIIVWPKVSEYRESKYLDLMRKDSDSVRVAEAKYFADKKTYVEGTSTNTPPLTNLAKYGLNKISADNKVVVTKVSDITKDFKVTVTSSKVAGKVVVYDSTTGKTDIIGVQGMDSKKP